jgi:hypothetical protein
MDSGSSSETLVHIYQTSQIFDNRYHENLVSLEALHGLYCTCPGVQWLIMTGSGLNDWIYWHLLQPLVVTINYSAIANLPISQIIRTRSILVLVLRCTPCTLLYSYSSQLTWNSALYSLGEDPTENIFSIMRVYWLVTQQWMPFYCWQRNSGTVFTEPFPSNGHMRHNTFRLLEVYHDIRIIKIVIFWIMTLTGFLGRHQCFGGIYYFLLHFYH